MAVTANITGLEPNRTYHFRLRAMNAAGPSVGEVRTFTTGATAPTVTTGGQSNLTSTSVVLQGTVNQNGSATSAAFEYGFDRTYGSAVAVTTSIGSGSASVAVSAQISSLIPNRTYHYHLVAENAGGRVEGANATFPTPAALPAAVTNPAGNITTSSAVLSGMVNPNGSMTTARFVYGLPGALVKQTFFVEVGRGTSDVPVSATISGLAPFTDYEFRLEANGAGTALGNIRAFKTELTPLIARNDAIFAAVNGTEFTIEPLANDDGNGKLITRISSNLGGRVSISTHNRRLTFRPSENPSLTTETFDYTVRDLAGNEATARVSVRYFTGSRGTYFGNFTIDQRLLRVRLDLDFAGTGSGRFEWEDEQYPFKIRLSSTGTATVQKARSEENAATLVMDLALDTLAQAIVGTFRDIGPIPVNENFSLQFLPATPDFLPTKGLQVAIIDPGDDGTGGGVLSERGIAGAFRPEGVGFSRVKIGKKGRATFLTKMPDFGTFSASLPVKAGADRLPRYELGTIRYKRKGSGRIGSISGAAFSREVTNSPDRISGSTGRSMAWDAHSLRSWKASATGASRARVVALTALTKALKPTRR